MLTECPSCHTVFRVTVAILKMGHGQVRCGKCRTQFDALESLLDEDTDQSAPRQSTPPEEPAESPPDTSIVATEPDSEEDITMEGSRIEISGTYRVPSDLDREQVIHEHVVIDREQPLEIEENDEEIVAEIDLQSDDGEPVAEAAHHLLDEPIVADRGIDSDTGRSSVQTSLPISQRLWKLARSRPQPSAEHREIAAELSALTSADAPPTAPRRNLWIAVSVVAVIAMIAQVVHHNRDPLVRHPKWGDTIARVYRSLGLTLTPNWDVRSYELQVWDVRLDPGSKDTLRVRASVTNTATFAQPYPLIKLALEDRWGMPVAQRALLPEEYLPSSATADRMMAPRQRSTAEVAVVDPGTDAVGFQSHACLRQNGGIVCADDVGTAK